MRRRILIPTLAVAVCGGTAIAIAGSININNANAELNLGGESLIAANNTLSSTSQVSTAKDETVYVITDDTGAAKTKFIGNTIYNGTDKLPFDFKITYYLDGSEISAKDIKGKSGHVKIVYQYNSTAQYQGKYVPFMAVTGLTLDSSKFTNLKINSGKIISEASDNYVIAGYSLTGLDKNLGTNFLSDSFTVEADVNNFELGNTYTMFMNDIFADIDTSKLSDIDSLVNSMTELSNGVDQIIAGAGTLSDGLASALDGTKALYAGSQALSAGAAEALEGATNLSDSLNYVTATYNDRLQGGANTVIKSTLASLKSNQKVQNIIAYLQMTGKTTKTEVSTGNFDTLLPLIIETAKTLDPTASTAELDSAYGLLSLSTGIIGYTDGIAQMAEKSPELVDGLTLISEGATELTTGLGTLVDGTTELYNGSVTLKDGLGTLKSTGIDKLVNFATGDLQRFTANLRSTVTAASNYHSFGDNTTAKSVKFILKTPSI